MFALGNKTQQETDVCCSSGVFLKACVDGVDVSQGHRLHTDSRLFGRCWHAGDVVGCMINLEDKSMIFTLNGEILITNKGSELCFADFDIEDG